MGFLRCDQIARSDMGSPMHMTRAWRDPMRSDCFVLDTWIGNNLELQDMLWNAESNQVEARWTKYQRRDRLRRLRLDSTVRRRDWNRSTAVLSQRWTSWVCSTAQDSWSCRPRYFL